MPGAKCSYFWELSGKRGDYYYKGKCLKVFFVEGESHAAARVFLAHGHQVRSNHRSAAKLKGHRDSKAHAKREVKGKQMKIEREAPRVFGDKGKR